MQWNLSFEEFMPICCLKQFFIEFGKNMYIDVSTVDGATSKLIGTKIKDTGALFLEAPVSGSKKPAEDGQLIFLTAVQAFEVFYPT
ncbi:hypothetical protein CsSME_00007705 [Camellia sinensis var. sinensis]